MPKAHMVKLSFTIHEEEAALLYHAANEWDETLSEVIRRGLYQGYKFLSNRRDQREASMLRDAGSSIAKKVDEMAQSDVGEEVS